MMQTQYGPIFWDMVMTFPWTTPYRPAYFAELEGANIRPLHLDTEFRILYNWKYNQATQGFGVDVPKEAQLGWARTSLALDALHDR